MATSRFSPSLIIGASFVFTFLTVANAFHMKKQFYTSIVFLMRNGSSMAVLYFQGAVLAYLLFTFLRWIFFGQLRVAEVEHALERFWHAIIETCLAFTVFRDDFSPKFVVYFVVLFFFKGFHWLAEDRVDYMERSPVITTLFHARIFSIMSLLAAVDSYFISHAYLTTVQKGASAQIVFGFEYAILITMIFHILAKYLLHLKDMSSPHPWEGKAVYMLYTELVVSFLRCVLYFFFAVLMLRIHTFPLFAIRPFYLTLSAFRKAIYDVIQSRRAINAMNNLFPLATEQELRDGDNTCIICREEMTVESGAKKLPCNHIFHPNCLRSWFQRQQTCPTCRTDVLGSIRTPQQQGGGAGGVAGGFQQVVPPEGVAAFFAGFGFPQLQQARDQQRFQQQLPNQQQQGVQQGGQIRFEFGGNVFNLPINQRFGGAPGQQPPPQFLIQGMQPPIIPGQPQAAADPAEAAAGAEAGGAVPIVDQQQAGMMPQFMQNPFGLSPFTFPTPYSFPQPPTFSGLSDVELSQMEGQERAAIEARLQALRNVQTLLEAATLQFQQYLSVAPALIPPGPFAAPTPGATTTPLNTPNNEPTNQSTPGTSTASAGPSTVGSVPSSTLSAAPSSTPGAPSSTPGTSSSSFTGTPATLASSSTPSSTLTGPSTSLTAKSILVNPPTPQSTGPSTSVSSSSQTLPENPSTPGSSTAP